MGGGKPGSKRADALAQTRVLLHVPVTRDGKSAPAEIDVRERRLDPAMPDLSAQRESRHGGKRELAAGKDLETGLAFGCRDGGIRRIRDAQRLATEADARPDIRPPPHVVGTLVRH